MSMAGQIWSCEINDRSKSDQIRSAHVKVMSGQVNVRIGQVNSGQG